MSNPKQIYWDSSCFICFLNKGTVEVERRKICEDVLRHARNGDIEIWTSAWTITEVIRPRRPGSAPMPEWALMAVEAVKKEFPAAQRELEALWQRYQAAEPSTKLTTAQVEKIHSMFEWQFIKLINLDERVAREAVKLSRGYGLKPADSVHAASAILKKVEVLQKWDRDFDKVKSLIQVEEPQWITTQTSLIDTIEMMTPKPEDFE